jgi:hypothetical protein
VDLLKPRVLKWMFSTQRIKLANLLLF